MGYRKVSQKMRERILEDREQGMTLEAIAAKYNISTATAHKTVTDSRDNHIKASFEDEWNDARSRILGYRIGWKEEWNEARERLLKGARC